MIITGIYNLKSESSWSLLQLQEIYLECDTTLLPVTINLFEIAELQGYKNLKIYISDIGNNASINNIVINSAGFDEINATGQTAFSITANGSCCILSIMTETKWAGFTQSLIANTGLTFKGSWDANSNAPILTSGIGTNGDYYIVSIAGTTNLDGITDWQVGDWAIFESTTNMWQKIDNHDIQAYNTIQEEGVSLPQRSIIDFQGEGATVTDNGAKTIVTVNGAAPTTNYGLFAQTANSTPITGTAAESTLVGTGVGNLSVPANSFKVGDSFVAKLYGHITCVGTATIQIRVKSGSVILGDTGIIALDVTTNKHWNIEVSFTIRSLGVASVGSIVSGGLFSYVKNSGLNFEGADFSIVNSTTFDTTILNTLNITAQWNSNNATNNIYSEIFTLTKTY